jgi:hypothetical protein
MRRRAWRLLAATLLITLFAVSPARAEWRRAESRSFIVYGTGSAAHLRARASQLEAFDGLLRAITGNRAGPPTAKLTVYLASNGTELRRVSRVGRWVAGFYTASSDAIVAVVNESGDSGEYRDDVLFHEYAHHFMLQYFPAAYPTWYAEGFAEYVMTARIEPDRIEYGNYNSARASWLADRQDWLPFNQILFANPAQLDGSRFYAQSWLLVHYLLSDAGRQERFADYLRRLSRDEEPRAAFVAAFAMQPEALQRALDVYARRISYHRMDRAVRADAAEVAVTELPASANDLLLLEAALLVGVRERDRAEVLERIRRLALRHNDPFARRVLARAEVLHGDGAVAERLLDELLAASPNDVDLLYLKGLRYLVAGRRDAAVRTEQFRRAQGLLARAHRANPNHVPTLYAYAESLSPRERFVTENTQNILLLANHLAPQVAAIRLSAAHMLLLRGDYAQAEALLLPLANSTHSQGAAERSKALLSLARARQRPPNEDVFAPLVPEGDEN